MDPGRALRRVLPFVHDLTRDHTSREAAASASRSTRFPRTVVGRRRSVRSPVRDATVVVFSASVIGLLVLYAIAAPSVSMSAGVEPVVPLPGRTAVVVGRVLSPGGGGLEGARIDVHSSDGMVRTTSSNAAGAFRVALPGRCARYTVAIRATADGSSVTASIRHRLCPGDALPVDARVVTQGQFLWIPGPR